MDAVDHKILNQIQRDAKITNKELAVKLGLSVTAVYERIDGFKKLLSYRSALANKNVL